MREVLILAGEASGDLHGGGVAAELGRLRPELLLTGMGGATMAAAGVRLFEQTDQLGVMGFAEVIRKVPHHWRLLRRIERRLASGQVALVMPIDYPGFNMRVAASARRHGVPVLYFITPQVWAWGAGRLPKLARLISRAAVILPFEEALLRKHGIDATFVGHPLLDRAAELPSRDDACLALGLDPGRPVLALFPGSRVQEVSRHLGLFVETARRLEGLISGLQVTVCAAPGMSVGRAAQPYPVAGGSAFTVLRAATAALCKSGTTTLEAAVAGCPLVVAYRTSGWTHAVARRVVKIPNIGLVNVVAGRAVAREFVQDAVAPVGMAAALLPLLTLGSGERALMLQDLDEVRARLGQAGAAGRVAEMASALIP